MGKRKRDGPEDSGTASVTKQTGQENNINGITLQIIIGSYERVLHGFTASIDLPTAEGPQDIKFSDTFLFHAHSSAIRCLALSPLSPSNEGSYDQKITLATGSTDERINLYHLSTTPPSPKDHIAQPTLGNTSILENPKNRELGALVHHSSGISALYFPTRSKLLSAAEDNTIAITRTRDWTALSTIKVPMPRAQGRPSGDTAAPGELPAGVNDFAVHPSMKLMVSVGKGEKCMRLWNLVTGKKAGVLTFSRDILQEIGEGKWGSGEGRKVEWDPHGNEFAIAFERGVVIFGMDSKPKSRILVRPLTKIHQIHYLPIQEGTSEVMIAVSTEDGRILFYSTTPQDNEREDEVSIKDAKFLGELGGKTAGVLSRFKDFELLSVNGQGSADLGLIAVTGSSDGIVRLWRVNVDELKNHSPHASKQAKMSENGTNDVTRNGNQSSVQISELLGMYETPNRITCLKAFVMIPASKEEAEESAFEGFDDGGSSESSEDSDS